MRNRRAGDDLANALFMHAETPMIRTKTRTLMSVRVFVFHCCSSRDSRRADPSS